MYQYFIRRIVLSTICYYLFVFIASEIEMFIHSNENIKTFISLTITFFEVGFQLSDMLINGILVTPRFLI